MRFLYNEIMILKRSLFFFEVNFIKFSNKNESYLFGCVELSEIFYVLNYGVKFYIYCFSGSMFRQQLYSICKFII